MIVNRGLIGAVVAACVLLLSASEASAGFPGELDPSFGGGKVVVPLTPGSGAGGVALQPDGKILVAGSREASSSFSVARLLPNGSPDPSWGGDGLVTTPLGSGAASYDVAVQPDGRVVVVGVAPGAKNQDFAIVRYLANGELDPSFGEGGVVILPVGPLTDNATAVAIGPGGRIAVTGISEVENNVLGAGTAVLEADGTPEAAFAGDGTTVIQANSENNDRGEGIAVQSDGKVVVADATGGGIGDGFTIVRLGLDGKPDPSFGGDGVVETPIPGEGEAAFGRVSDVLIQPDGKIVGGGYGADFGGTPPRYTAKFALARYTPDGELDPSFGTGGIVSVPGPEVPAGFGRALGLDAKGRLVLGGTYDPNPDPMEEDYAPALVRFNADGSLDPSFGAGGVVLGRLAAGVEDEELGGLAIQPEAKILATGTEFRETQPVLPVVSRYIADPEAQGGLPKADARPDTNMKRVPRKVAPQQLAGFRGSASDPDGEAVSKVQIALVRLRPGGKHRPAVRPEHWRTARGSSKWTYRLPHQLAAGRYVVFSRAIDQQGLAENEFSRADHNRYAFRVLAGGH